MAWSRRPQVSRPELETKPRTSRRWARLAVQIGLVLLLGPAVILALYRVLPPPVTPLMLVRLIEGEGWTNRGATSTRSHPRCRVL